MRKVTDDRRLEELSRDAGIIRIKPRAVFEVSNAAEISEVFEEARRERVSITPRGSGTSIPSQAVGGGYIVMHTGRNMEAFPDHVVCAPPVVKADLNVFLDSGGSWIPPDPSSYKACSVGGMVSNNSSGIRTYRYGSTIEYVRELEVVLPEEGPKRVRAVPLEAALSESGSTKKVASLLLENHKAILREVPKTRKNSSGYRLERAIHDDLLDLPKLFTGSEGTLCLMNRIDLRIVEKPTSRRLVIVSVEQLSDLDAVVSSFRRHRASAIELVDTSVFVKTGRESLIRRFGKASGYLVFCEVDGQSESEVDASLTEVAADAKIMEFDPLTLTDRAQIDEAWEVRDLTLTLAAEMREGSKVLVPGLEDVTVQPPQLGELLGFMLETFGTHGLDYISYGHAGDANLHMRPFLDLEKGSDKRLLQEMMRDVFERVWKMGGTITGEHGDGLLRAPFVEEQYPETYEIMQEVKMIYDPGNLLNPGVKIKVLD